MRLGIKKFFFMLSAFVLSSSYLIDPVFGATDAEKNPVEAVAAEINLDDILGAAEKIFFFF